MAEKPAFNPSQPFHPMAEKPVFDPSQPFQPAPEASVAGDVATEGGKGLARGTENLVGDLGEAVMGPFGPSHHFGNLMADLGLAERPKTEPTYGQQLAKATGMEASPKTTEGKYAGSIAEVAGNPASYLGPGGPLTKVAGAVGSGALSQAAGDVEGIKDTPFEMPARIAGGILGGVAAGAPPTVVRNTMRARGIPNTAELEAASNNAYNQARSLGVEYQPDRVEALRDQIHDTLIRRGYRGDNAGGAFTRVEEITDPPTPAIPGGNRDFSDIEGVRKSLNILRKEVHSETGRPTENASAARIAINQIDDFLADPHNAIPAHQYLANYASELAQEGRGNWASMSRSQQIEQALSRGDLNAGATGSGANVDNALRQQVKNILNNPKRARNFTADQRDMMRDIAIGNPVRNSARLLGKMAATGIVSASGIEYLSHLMGLGPTGHVLLPLAGYAAKKAGDAMTRNRINGLTQAIRTDSPLGASRNIPERTSYAPFVARSMATTPEPQSRGGAIGRAKRLAIRKH